MEVEHPGMAHETVGSPTQYSSATGAIPMSNRRDARVGDHLQPDFPINARNALGLGVGSCSKALIAAVDSRDSKTSLDNCTGFFPTKKISTDM